MNGGVKVDIAPKQLFRVLSNIFLFAADDYPRPVLTCLCFEGDKDGLHVTATDSYALATDILSTEPCSLPRFLVAGHQIRFLLTTIRRDLAKMTPRRSRMRVEAALGMLSTAMFTLVFGDEYLRVFGVGGIDVTLPSAEVGKIGEFPGWQHLFPKSKKASDAGFVVAAHRLARFTQVHGQSTDSPLHISHPDSGKPAPGPVVITEHNGTFRGLLMPWRS